MNKQEFKKELFNNLKELNDSQVGEIICSLVDELPCTSYERILCKIKNKNGTLKPDKDKFKKIETEIKSSYKRINNGEICFNCYSYPNGSYSYYEEDYDIYYYSNKEIDEVLDKTYEFGKTLIYHKEYAKAVAKGAQSVLEPTTEPWGQRTCYIADPEGNLIEIGSFNKPFNR